MIRRNRVYWYGWKLVYVTRERHVTTNDIDDIVFYLVNVVGIPEVNVGYFHEDSSCIEVSPDSLSKITGTYLIKGEEVVISEKEIKFVTQNSPIIWAFADDRPFWTGLSTDIQVYILGFLKSSDLLRASLVSKSWYLVSCSPVLWENLCNKEFPAIPNSENVVNWKDEFHAKNVLYKIERQKFTNMHKIRMAQRHWMMCGVHMFHPVNGRRGFDLVSPPANSHKKPPVEVMIKMLKREEELRLSEEIQEKFRNPDLDTIHVAAQVQERVVCEFGFHNNICEMVDFIRAAPSLYPETPEVRRIPHYQKFNRVAEGYQKPGDIIPDAELSTLNGSSITLYNYIDTILGNKKPIVITAGSYT